MPATIKCSSCGKRLTVRADDAGQAVVCPACGVRTQAPAGIPQEIPAAPAPPPATPPASAPPAQHHLGLIAAVLLFALLLVGVVWATLWASKTPRTTDDRPAPPATQPAAAPAPLPVPPPPPATIPATLPTQPQDPPPPTRPSPPAPRPPLDEKVLPPAEAMAASIVADPPADTVRSRPPLRRTTPPAGAVSDEQIEQSIRRGVDYLLSSLEDGQLMGLPEGGRPNAYYSGLNALCVYALMQGGEALRDQRLSVRGPLMRRMIDRMKQMPIEQGPETYARAIRAMALSHANRPEDQAALRADVTWLMQATRNGAYTYTTQTDPNRWDNSNSQYGLLGVWSAAEAGIEVPVAYWTKVEHHWAEAQRPNGQWSYKLHSNGRLSMTAAGLASLFVTHDYLEAPKFGGSVGRPPFSPLLARGLEWFERDDNAIRLPLHHWGYALYGIERVGLASGFKYFGRHDWYRTLAADAISRQNADGSWPAIPDTPFAILFLARGRHPILMNKLRFDGEWANRPRDLANLSRFASRQLERQLNWQVVSLERDWSDWMDSPILYLASHRRPGLSATDREKLAGFAWAGGMIYTQADGDSPAFNAFARELGEQLFSGYAWEDVPDDHELYSVIFRLKDKPKLRMITNGSRILMLHSPMDLSRHWQMRAEKTRRPAFEFGVNLFVYAAGKTDLRNRLASPYLPEPALPPTHAVTLARVSYEGNWNPEPHAMTRFSRWLGYQTGLGLEVAAIPMRRLDRSDAPLAWLTGTTPFEPSASETAALRDYVKAGGVLLIDSCGGGGAFHESVLARVLPMAFDLAQPRTLRRDDPILSAGADGMEDLSRARLRPYTLAKSPDNAPRFEVIRFGDGCVIITPLDLTTAMLNTQSWGINGYEPAYAQSFVKNLLLWTLDRPVHRQATSED